MSRRWFGFPVRVAAMGVPSGWLLLRVLLFRLGSLCCARKRAKQRADVSSYGWKTWKTEFVRDFRRHSRIGSVSDRKRVLHVRGD